MRILAVGNFYPPRHVGGYEAVWQAANRALRDAGHEVRVLVSDAVGRQDAGEGDPGIRRELRSYWRDHEWPAHRPWERLAVERHNAAVLRRHLDDVEPALVMWWSMGGMSLSLIEQVRRRDIPALGVVHDEWMAYGPRVDLWLRAWRRRPRGARVAEALTRVPTRVDFDGAGAWSFNSDFTQRHSLGSDGLALGRTSVISPGIDPEAFPARPVRQWTGSLVCVGRIDERKGLSVALGALAHLAGAHLLVAGDGDRRHRDELGRLAHRLGVSERVTFVGRVARERLGSVYGDADAVLFPVTWDEPWGLVPLEAMSTGRPVIATGTGGSAEYLVDGENALIVPPGDAAALAAAVQLLAGDPGLRDHLRAVGAATATRFTEQAFHVALEREARRAAGIGAGGPADRSSPVV